MIIYCCIGKALIQTEEFCKFILYPHLLTYENIIKIFMSFLYKKYTVLHFFIILLYEEEGGSGGRFLKAYNPAADP